MNALVEQNPMISMIERVALSQDADITKLEKLLDMQERIAAKNSREEFFSAFSEMQLEMPEIIERSKAHNTNYASLEDINEQVKPILQKYGFGIMFKVSQPEPTKILVTGVLSHRGGHAEETAMLLPYDTSGSKNAVQAIGSSTSYGKRYVLCALLNISTRGEDDDGTSAITKSLTEHQKSELLGILGDCSETTRDWFRETYIGVNNVPKNQYDQVRAKLIKARDAAKKG